MSDRGGRKDEFDLRWEEPARRGSREDRPADEPPRGEEDLLAGRPSRESGRGGVRRRGGGGRQSTGSGTGLYGSEIGSNMSRAAVAELVGTFILVYAGTTVAVLATLEVPVIGTPFDSLAVPLAFGLTLAALGPIIVAWNNWDSALLYIIAPIVVGVLAAFLYDGFISDADAPQ